MKGEKPQLPGEIKCENCETGMMAAFGRDSLYWYYQCKNKRCGKERLILFSDAPPAEGGNIENNPLV